MDTENCYAFRFGDGKVAHGQLFVSDPDQVDDFWASPEQPAPADPPGPAEWTEDIMKSPWKWSTSLEPEEDDGRPHHRPLSRRRPVEINETPSESRCTCWVSVWIGGQIVLARAGAGRPHGRPGDPPGPGTPLRTDRVALLRPGGAHGIWNLVRVSPGDHSVGWQITLGVKLLLVAVSGVTAFLHGIVPNPVARLASRRPGAARSAGGRLLRRAPHLGRHLTAPTRPPLGQLTCLSRPSQYGDRSMNFCSLPVAVRASSSRNSTDVGHL